MDKILIADNLLNTKILKKILANNTCSVYTSNSGHNTLKKIKAINPDLVILKTDLKDIDGYEICKKIKHDIKTQNIIVLLLSNQADKSSRIKASEAGADDFLEKKSNPFVLIARVRSLLRIKYLREQLQKKYSELEQTNKILANQLEMAQQLQHSLIPELNINIGELNIFSRYLPAMYIGGDFYNVITLKNKQVLIVLGDVSGHGISAALLTAMLINMIKNITDKRLYRPDKILYKLNQDFFSAMNINANDIYACVFVALIDLKNKKIFYSNAGQSIPVFVSNINNINPKIINMEIAGTPIGLISNAKYEIKTLNYKSGDKIFFHTDGLENNFYKNDPDGFSYELKKILLEPYDNINNLSESILKKFYYGTEQDKKTKNDIDDVSLIICQL